MLAGTWEENPLALNLTYMGICIFLVRARVLTPANVLLLIHISMHCVFMRFRWPAFQGWG